MWIKKGASTGSNFHNVQFGKGGAIVAIIKREQAVAFFQSMSANEKVRQNAAWLTRSLFAATICVFLKRFSGNSPDRFIYGPIGRNTGIRQKFIQKVFGTPRESQQLREDCAANYEFAARKCRIESRLSG
jgi:hypothetical protein